MSWKNRLHVWENPLLHGKLSTDPPVEVIFDDDEYDYWNVNNTHGTLTIGRVTTVTSKISSEVYETQAPHTILRPGSWIKVWEEYVFVEDEVGAELDANAQERPSSEPVEATVLSPSDTHLFVAGEKPRILFPKYELAELGTSDEYDYDLPGEEIVRQQEPYPRENIRYPEKDIPRIKPPLSGYGRAYPVSYDDPLPLNKQRIKPDIREIVKRIPTGPNSVPLDVTAHYQPGDLLGLHDEREPEKEIILDLEERDGQDENGGIKSHRK